MTERRPGDRCHLSRAGYVAAFDRQLSSLEECTAEAPPGEVRMPTRVREAAVGLGPGIELLGTAIAGRVPL